MSYSAFRARQRATVAGESDPPRYLLYRCESCKAIVTKGQIMASWKAAVSAAVCPCGGSKIRPTNPRFLEEFLPRVIATWWAEIAKPRLGFA